MDFFLTTEQEKTCEQARSVAGEIFAQGAAARDASRAFPGEEIAKLAERGWLGMRVDSSDGGMGCDATSASLVVEEFSRACASIGLVVGLHAFLICDGIRRHGSDRARSEYLPKLARGELLGAVAFADPATSSAAEKVAVATRSGDSYRLNGFKPFVPAAVGADLFVVYAFLAGDDGGSSGERILLLVPRSAPGLTVGSTDPLVGVRASGTASVRFDDCEVAASNRLGEESEAKTILKELLAAADLVVASQAVGIATAALDRAVGRASERELTDKLVGSRQSVQFMVADMLVDLEAARLYVLRAADALQSGGDFVYQAAQAKGFAGRAAVRVADTAIQILGTDATLADHGIERNWRDAKTTELNPSTREVAYLLVARHLLEASS
jgi:alkylation response protein AidB-like acyl-CoA dehydrogenase